MVLGLACLQYVIHSRARVDRESVDPIRYNVEVSRKIGRTLTKRLLISFCLEFCA